MLLLKLQESLGVGALHTHTRSTGCLQRSPLHGTTEKQLQASFKSLPKMKPEGSEYIRKMPPGDEFLSENFRVQQPEWERTASR